MPIQSGDIKLLASKIMDDVSNGGGGPSGVVIADGASNAIFNDVTELDRSNGAVSIRQLTVSVQTPDTDSYMGCTIVVSKPPNDPNVSITLAKCIPFARRTDIANTLENYLIQASEWSGFLFENHVAGQRSIQLFQRPGMPLPPIGRTFALIQSEGLPAQVTQYVRTTKVESVTRTFTEVSGSGSYYDYQATVVTCELTDALRSNFAGSPPSRLYARNATKTGVRDTTVADAAMFYGATTLSSVGAVGDSVLKVSSVYTQLVPSSRTESIALDQKPASQRRLTLAQSPRLIEIGVTPHTMRVRVGQENRGFAWTQMLKPRPAPGTVVISYMAFGNWYTITDDGLGVLTGAGVGTVNYQTGSVAVTMPAMPDAGSSIIFSWGENTAYTSRAGQAGYRAPEFAWALPHQGVKPASVVVTWMSGNVLKTATDNGSGAFAGDAAVGEVDYAAGKIYLRPTAMIDAGGEFQTAYEYTSTRTETFAGVAPDAGGFASLTLSEVPAAKSVAVRWITTRTVSASSGTSSIVSTTAKGAEVHTVVVDPPQPSGNAVTPSSHYTMPGQDIAFKVATVAPQTMGTYHWEIAARMPWGAEVDASLVLGGATTGTFSVTNNWVFGVAGSPDASGTSGTQNYPVGIGMGKFVLTITADCPDLVFNLRVKNQALTTIAVTNEITVDAVGDNPAVPWVNPPPSVIVVRNPDTGDAAQPIMEKGGLRWQDRAYVYVRVVRTNLATGSIYADADGMGYDLPEVLNTLVIWSPSDLAAGFKTITSTAGVPTVYHLWK